jgi:hypothetical protein
MSCDIKPSDLAQPKLLKESYSPKALAPADASLFHIRLAHWQARDMASHLKIWRVPAP